MLSYVTVSDAIKRIEDGEIVLPEIQRKYVWKRSAVVAFMDSLYQKFPMGAVLLFWKTEQHNCNVKAIEGSSLQKKESPIKLLDGQQRLTSIYRTLCINVPEDQQINVYFNVDKEIFSYKKPPKMYFYVNIRDIVNSEHLVSFITPHLMSKPTGTKYYERLHKLKQILNYVFPVETLENDDYSIALKMYERVNSGVTLKNLELTLGKLAFNAPALINTKFEQTIEKFKKINFNLEYEFLVRLLVVCKTNNLGKNSHYTFFEDTKDLNTVWEAVDSALSKAINALKDHGNLDRNDYLKNNSVFIMLVYLFYCQPKVSTKLAIRWFFCSLRTANYGDDGYSSFKRDMLKIYAKENIVDILKGMNVPKLTLAELKGKTRINPLYTLLYMACIHKNAKDLFSGNEIRNSKKIYSYCIFPGLRGKEKQDIANQFFTSTFYSSRTSSGEYLKEIPAAYLRSQFIPTDPKLLNEARAMEFLEERRRLIKDAINGLTDLSDL